MPQRRTPQIRGTLAALAVATLTGQAAAQGVVPLEGAATRLVNFETANMLPRQTWSIQPGSHQTNFDTGAGTGSQNYYLAVDWAATSNLQLGFTTQVQQDAPIKPIAGSTANIRFLTVGGSAKYRFVNTGGWQIAALGSIEYLSFRTAIFGTNVSDDGHVIGSAQLPITYSPSQLLQFHLTPAVSFLPGDLNGLDFYGTVVSIGAGVTFQPSDRFQAYAAVNVPVDGGNTITTTRAITDEPIYTVGVRYAFTPKVALEGYVTNAIGISPATGILSFWPDGDEPLIGLRLHYTPGAQYRETYRPTPLTPATPRDRRLQQDGFTLAGADVLDPAHLRVTASGGDQGNYAVAGFISTDRDFQLEAMIEENADDGSLPGRFNPTRGEPRYMVGGRIQVLDQRNGDSVSLSARVLAGRDVTSNQVGVLYIGMPITYQSNDRLAFNINPKFTAFGNTRIGGLGLGVNWEVAEGLQLVGEVTPTTGGSDDPVWAAGARYQPRNSDFSVDLSATNSIGRYGLGTLVAQDDPRFALGVSVDFSLR